MTRLWGMINTMQFIVLMPLVSANVPANVYLVFYMIQANLNMQVLPIKLKSILILDN